MRNRTWLMMVSLVGLAAVLGGCSSTGKPVDISKLGEPLSTIELAEAHNARVEPLDRLWARISLRARGTYSDGESYEEQGEGHLQIVKPNNISIAIGKLGETYFAFGANAEDYWCFDLSNSDYKSFLIGKLDQATPEKVSALGLPVHPAELVALTGLMPIDLSKAGGSRWANDGKTVGVSVPSQWGSFTLWFDPKTKLVARSQAFDRAGTLIASADLSRYKDATIREHAPVLVPGKIEITNPNDSGWVRIEVSEPEDKAINSRVYQPRKLARGYRVDETIDLDAAFESDTTAQEIGDDE